MKGMSVLCFCVVLLGFTLSLLAQTPQWDWAVSAGGTGDDSGWSIAIDSQGNQYVTGSFYNTASFGTYTLTSNGSFDVFAAKLDTDGNWLWAVSAGGTGLDESRGIALDPAGNAFLTGYFSGTASFGTHTLTSNGNEDVFAAKLDPDGNWLWAVSAGGISQDSGSSIAVDPAGNVFLTGFFDTTASFGTYTLTSNGSTDAFAAKLDTDGNWLWAVSAGGPVNDYCSSIAIDSQGNQYVTGLFRYTVSFGTHSLTANGSYDVFVAKLDPNGNWLWAVRAGGSDADYGISIALDPAGNACLIGYFEGTAWFGTHTLTSNGGYDVFAAKLGASGNWLWAVNAGGSNHDWGHSIALDPAGNAFLTGSFTGLASFGTHTITSSGGNDIFAAKLDPDGNWLWAMRAGGLDWDIGNSIAVDPAGNACLTGYFEGTASYGAHTLTSNGGWDIFVARINSGTPVDDELHTPAASLALSASPNPFSISTAIKVVGDKPEHLSGNYVMDIFDLRGRKIRSLALDAISGVVSQSWDGRDDKGLICPNGIYLARLELGGRRATLKLSLVK
jgi:hypothetical protein